MKKPIIIFLLICSGCVSSLPDYVISKCGPVVYESWESGGPQRAGAPEARGWFETLYGYVELEPPHIIHIKNKTLLERMMIWYPDSHILQHEQLHSFELTIRDNNWMEYHNYINDLEAALGRDVDIEDLPEIYSWGRGEAKRIVNDFVNGKYQSGFDTDVWSLHTD